MLSAPRYKDFIDLEEVQNYDDRREAPIAEGLEDDDSEASVFEQRIRHIIRRTVAMTTDKKRKNSDEFGGFCYRFNDDTLNLIIAFDRNLRTYGVLDKRMLADLFDSRNVKMIDAHILLMYLSYVPFYEWQTADELHKYLQRVFDIYVSNYERCHDIIDYNDCLRRGIGRLWCLPDFEQLDGLFWKFYDRGHTDDIRVQATHMRVLMFHLNVMQPRDMHKHRGYILEKFHTCAVLGLNGLFVFYSYFVSTLVLRQTITTYKNTLLTIVHCCVMRDIPYSFDDEAHISEYVNVLRIVLPVNNTLYKQATCAIVSSEGYAYQFPDSAYLINSAYELVYKRLEASLSVYLKYFSYRDDDDDDDE